jgi:hypothetical protein
MGLGLKPVRFRLLGIAPPFVRLVSNFWSVTSFPSTSETTEEIFGDGDRDGRVMTIPWPRRC